jgi:DNA modification methylase
MAWQLYQGDALETLKQMEDESINCCVTSPPYWGLRDYGVDGQLGLEPTPDEYVAKMVEVFREVKRVLRNDGTLWLNLGDSYVGSWGNYGGQKRGMGSQRKIISGSRIHQKAYDGLEKWRPPTSNKINNLKPKDLAGIPWRVALALQADGWWLRSDIIWCLSGGTWVYAKTQKGEMPMMIKDVARLDPKTVKLWNGEKWTQVLGMSRSERKGDEIELVLRSGERISCTPTHKFPTDKGLKEAKDITIGDVLQFCRLPEPEQPRDCVIDEDAAWLAGLYIAEGSMAGDTIQIAGHTKEVERWERLQKIANKYGGSITRTIDGNKMDIRMYGKVLVAMLSELVSGKTAKNKCFAPVVWRYSNKFIESILDGYLSGDGHYEKQNDRWRLGFTRNYNLERDLRTACSRLGYRLTLNLSTVLYNGRQVPTFRGEIRKTRSGHFNEKNTGEVLEISKARCRYVWDIGVEDEPHLFALASGILTHNSKPNPMPESVRDRPTKAHEYIFLLSKSDRYFYDNEAIKEPASNEGKLVSLGDKSFSRGQAKGKGIKPSGNGNADEYLVPAGRNKRTVWNISTKPFSEAHFAVFPPDLIEPCILAGTSPMACPHCGAPWERVVERIAGVSKECPKTQAAHEARGGTGKPSGTVGKSGGGRIDSISRTIGWRPTCACPDNDGSGRCVVLDPFAGAGTTLWVAEQLGRNSIGIELNPDYCKIIERRMNSIHLNLFEGGK